MALRKLHQRSLSLPSTLLGRLESYITLMLSAYYSLIAIVGIFLFERLLNEIYSRAEGLNCLFSMVAAGLKIPVSCFLPPFVLITQDEDIIKSCELISKTWKSK